MSDIFDKLTKIILKSRDTNKYIQGGEYYEADRYIINPAFVPDCVSKYIFIEVDDTLREMTPQEKDAEDYVAPPTPPTLPDAKVMRQNAIKEECKNYINAAYTPEIQRSAALHVYPFDTEMQISEFVSNCVAEEDRCYDLVEAATDLAGVDAVTPAWPAVV